MSMTRKHFNDLADRMKHIKPSPDNNPLYSESFAMWRRTVWEMVDFCRSQNGRFDTGRFTVACGLDE